MAASVHVIRPALGSPSLTVDGVLGAAECYAKLATHRIGRIAFFEGALPVVLPARYAVSGQDIYLSVGPQTEQHAAIGGHVVALEVDRLDPRSGFGWAVTVTGIAEPCTHPSRWPLIARLGLASMSGAWPSVFRLPLGIISGRRINGI